ncbi:MAG: ABC transporter permease [Candidatus Aureabacteria bacterium]|nr:ABC transporter permease [Candidatus Auribacterota bacterium]
MSNTVKPSLLTGVLAQVGRWGIFSFTAARWTCSAPPALGSVLWEAYQIGVQSLSIVCVIAFFIGSTIALQGYYAFREFGGQNLVGIFVALACVREMGPIVAGSMVAAKAGTAMAATIATMRVKGQIDALEVMAVNPYRYLISPRLLASLIALPLLVVFADFITVFAGYLVAVYQLGVNSGTFLENVATYIGMRDVFFGMIKGGVFALLICLLSCYQGYYSQPGPEGVGRATNRAVVSVCIICIIMNYLLSEMMYG